MQAVADNLQTARSRRSPVLTLLPLVLLFGLPPLLAWLFFLNPQWLPERHSNHGELIDPPRSLTELSIKGGGQGFEGAWRLLVIGSPGCEADCRGLLAALQQVKRATGAAGQHIQPVLLVSDEAVAGVPDYVEVIHLGESRAPIRELFQLDSYPPGQHSFVIDPMGTLMMRHDHQRLDSQQILADMETLLKISQNWVKGAQYGHN